jgi:hypothetical protein
MTQTHPGTGKVEAPPSKRWQTPVGLGAGVAVATLALRLRDPHQGGSWGFCPSRALTGIDCPLCGGLRAVNDLTHGDIGAAWYSNALLVGSAPVLVALWIWWLVASLTGRPAPSEHKWAKGFLWAYGALIVFFWIFRNTPWGRDYWA